MRTVGAWKFKRSISLKKLANIVNHVAEDTHDIANVTRQDLVKAVRDLSLENASLTERLLTIRRDGKMARLMIKMQKIMEKNK